MQGLIAYLTPLADPLSSRREIEVRDLAFPLNVIARGIICDWRISSVREWCEQHGFVVADRLLEGFAYTLLRR